MTVDHKADVDAYIAGVLDGSIVTGRLERLAVHRHVTDLEKAGDRGFYFDERLASKAIEFAKFCCHFKGDMAGKPFSMRPEQKFVTWCLFGWRQKSDGLRRFRQAQLEVGRKWGKSFYASYLACKLSLADDPPERGSEGLCVATKVEQGKQVFETADKMIRRSPALMKRSKLTPSTYLIEFPEVDGKFQLIASDSKTVDGFNPHFIIKDEEHAWREHHRGLAQTLKSGFGARSQPITITITTYGDDESLIWQENHDYAVKCLESVISGDIHDDTWFAFICALDYRDKDSQPTPCFKCKGESCPWCDGAGVLPVDDPYDERVWRKANPGIGTLPGFTPKLARMRESATEAKNGINTNEFFQKNLNIRVAAKNKFVLPEAWNAGKGEISVTGVTGHGGLDLGRTHDFSAIAAVFPFRETDDDGSDFVRYEAITKTWTVENRPRELQLPMIQRWIDGGHLIASPGEAVDFMDVEESILEWHRDYIIRTWAYDKTYAQQMAQRIEAEGLEPFSFTQSPKFYTEPISELLKIIGKTRKVNGVDVPLFKHNGNPCLAWQAGNLTVERNSRGEMMPDKSMGKNKIDAMVALLMAFSECLYHQGDSVDGYYLTNSLALGGSQKSTGDKKTCPDCENTVHKLTRRCVACGYEWDLSA